MSAPVIPPGGTFFDANTFKRSFVDVPLTARLPDLLGPTTFSLVKNDMNGNITKINQRYTEAPAESATLQELVVNELKSKKHVATEGLLWLTRGLEFMCLALNANINNKTEELATSFRNAYGTTLKPHHSFVVKPLFSAAMSACPARNDFYKKLGDDEAKVNELMQQYLGALDKIIGILKAFVNSKEAKW
ncbi:het-c2 protein [Diaporthe eres]|nr:het-c2 protein [Diaporthe eres]